MTEFHNPGNEAPIDRLYVFMSIDDQGRHGIVAHFLPGLGSTPLVTGSRRTAKVMQAMADEVARETGMRVGLFIFNRGDMIWSAEP